MFLSELVILPYSPRVAITWGDLQAHAQLRGRPRPANDTWIAACCLVRELPLITYNRKDFEDFADHEDLESAGVVEVAPQVVRVPCPGSW